MTSEDGDENVGKVERITKLDAVRRQLRTALLMFFHEGDAVSIHTLASASQDVLFGLLKQKNRRRPKGQVEEVEAPILVSFKARDNAWIRPEKRDEYWALMTEAQNFFKHANSDPDSVIEFRPAMNDFVLMDCVDMYLRYTGRWLKESVPFVPWFAATYPNTIRPRDSLPPDQTSWLELLARAVKLLPQDQWKAAFLASLDKAELLGDTD